MLLVLYIYCILWSGVSYVVVILVTRCVVLFSTCVGVVAVYLFYV